ncbi:MAG: TatD family hydrolase [Xanthomonadales bacterium]|nr:TatD family hydrolase [Xanthomonadales bacterium]
MALVDSHCHLDAPEFDADREAVLARARAAGVAAQIVPAVARAGWPKLAALAEDAPDLHPAYGLHPCYLAEHRPEHLDRLAEWLATHRAVAVGECGLDFFLPGLDRNAQEAILLGQLRLARELDLPVILHARRAVDAVIAAIRRVGGLRGVVHSFSGSLEQARQLWRLGFLTGFGGPLTYPTARRVRALVAATPAEFLLLETDAPDQPPAARRGERNEPAALATILEEAARLRGETPEALAALTAANAGRLFGIAVPSPLH